MLVVQFLKSLGANVTGVCSGRNEELVLSKGADDVIDYTQRDFGSLPRRSFDRVFDTIGGRETERAATKVLKRSGRFVTIVGPIQHVGERKLSWPEFLGTVVHILTRYCSTLFWGPRYLFGAKVPSMTIRDAMERISLHGITMPVESEIAFDLSQIKNGVRLLTSHRTKGRIVINFQASGTQH